MIDNLNEGICIIDTDNNFVFSNPAANQIFGENRYDINNKNLLDYLSESQRQLYLEKLLAAGKNDIPSYELEILRSENEKRTIIIKESVHIVEGDLAGYFAIFHDITERKKAVEQIEEAGRLYQTLFMDAPIRIWEVDNSQAKKEIEKLRNKGVEDFERFFNEHHDIVKELARTFRTITYNKLVEKYFSNENSQIIPLDQFLCEESYPAFIQELLAIANNKNRATYELTSRSNTGGIRHSLVNWSVVPGYEHDYSRVIISAVDITDRKNTEIELKASEEKFRQLAENSGVGIVHIDANNKVVFLNKKALEFFGEQPNTYYGKRIEEIYGSQWGKIIMKRIKKIKSVDHTLTYEDHISSPQGERWYYANYTPILNQQNEHNGLQIIFNDISEKKILEKETQSLARFPQENPSPVLRISKTGKVIYSNQGAEKILHLWDYENSGQVPEEISRIVSECLKSKKQKIIEVQAKKKIFSLYFTPIPEMGYVNIYGRDITRLKDIEDKLLEYSKDLEKIIAEKTDELVQAQDRLLRQEKLATMGQLASSVGHELRNPLAVINNSLYMLRLNDSKQDAASKDYMDIIDQEVSNANKIITDLLTFARIKPVDLNPTNMHTLIEEILHKFPPPENVIVSIRFAEDLPLSLIDSSQIKQVIANLVTNAYQAIPVEGELIIDGRKTSDQIKIDFIDNGVGIPPENMEKIFEPLFTTKAKGIGLGLTVSKMLAEVNNGRIKVESTVGKGSVFSLFLPIFEGEL
jgi:PAS domain S-box-containing protein